MKIIQIRNAFRLFFLLGILAAGNIFVGHDFFVPNACAGQPQEPQPAVPPSCGDCFLITVEFVTPNYEIQEKARGKHFPWDRQFEKEAYHKALQYCAEKFTDGKCPSAQDCGMEREVTTESLDDIYPDDGIANPSRQGRAYLPHRRKKTHEWKRMVREDNGRGWQKKQQKRQDAVFFK